MTGDYPAMTMTIMMTMMMTTMTLTMDRIKKNDNSHKNKIGRGWVIAELGPAKVLGPGQVRSY